MRVILAGKAPLTSDEMAGYRLFDGKAACNTCHLDGRGSTQTQLPEGPDKQRL